MKSIALIVLALVACGGDTSSTPDADTTHIDPKLVAGGGVRDAPVNGLLHVYVVELDSSTPIVGATVRVEKSPPVTGTTDATGLATFRDPSLTGALTITATASGHAATTWIGVIGANATLPLEPSPHSIPMAHVTGTIAGWNNINAPAFGHYNLGVILYSFLDDPSALENSIAQPMNGTTPLNTCVRSAIPNTCAWEMNARIGKQIHTAVIVDGDTHGTSSDLTDDTYTLIGYASGDPVTLTAGQQLSNESLAMVSATTPMTINMPAAPGLAHAIAVPELALGDAGRIVFPLPTLTPANLTTSVLAATGKFAGTYKLVALATPNATAKAPFTSTFLSDATQAVTWLAPPTVTAGTTLSFTGTSSFHTAQLLRGTQAAWNIMMVDSTTSFTLPAITPDPLGAGSITFAVTAAEVPTFDASNFNIPALKAALTRASGAQATFTH